LGPEEKVPLGERNPKWLNDDYVKFMRFAQLKMDGYNYQSKTPDGKLVEHPVEGVEHGVVGVITNHSWLDNPTFRGMRQSLMRSFDQIYVVDLHGSTKPKERVPEGKENENVFDIQKGVAITLMVKKKGLERGVWHQDIWGSRLEKYQECSARNLADIGWAKAEAFTPYYMMSPVNWAGWEDYGSWWQIADSLNPQSKKKQIFSVNVLGFQTHRDHFAIAFDREEIVRRVRDMRDQGLSDELLQERYSIEDNRDWSLGEARQALQDLDSPEQRIIGCAFRPFDSRACYFGSEFMDYPRRELLVHVALRQNLQLLVSRQIGTGTWRHTLVAQAPANDCAISDSSSEANYVFPLWLYDEGSGRSENLSPEFREFIDARYDHRYSPEKILGYIYAVLHAPAYRSRYAEFLSIDFPRIPFAESAADFDALSALGSALVEAHLLRDVPRRGLAAYHGRGDHRVEFVRYSKRDEAVSINKTQSFRSLPEPVWDFRIGGYQVLDKYLKSRKGRALSLDEIDHIGKVADSLAFTIEQMARIDEAYNVAFADRG
jgi:predicted helicase